jgi:methylene-tetrahydromethanopterin dehydrogenase
MADKNILHMLTPTKLTSPFDVNVALDAGYDAVLTYNNVTLDEVTGLVQDAMFSRPAKLGVRTGMFFGGKNASLALDMLATAKKALVPPFGISFFADPAGSFTTAAAMVACVEQVLKQKKDRDLKGRKVAVFGATGVVGYAAGVIERGLDSRRRVDLITFKLMSRAELESRAEEMEL